MFPFDVILFDVGGVLLTNGWDRKERVAAAAQFRLDGPTFESKHALVFEAWERGEIDLNEYLDTAVFWEPRSFTRSEFFAFMLAQSKLLPDGAMSILAELAASNVCMLGALNNEARETNEYRFNQFELRRFFKVAVSSCFVGLRKPEAAIYRCALDLLGRPPRRVLFIDDREENVAGAVAAGMKVIRFKGAGSLRIELTNMGVL